LANPARFIDDTKVEKWYKRNCNDVLGRECTAQEKADLLSWLITVK
jgi:cobalamin biosynthesis protein CbiG